MMILVEFNAKILIHISLVKCDLSTALLIFESDKKKSQFFFKNSLFYKKNLGMCNQIDHHLVNYTSKDVDRPC